MHLFNGNHVSLVVWIGLGLVGGTGCGRDSAPSRSAVSREVNLDLGTISPGSPAAGSLRLVNPSAQTWRITRVESSCPCLRVSPTEFEVKPGQSITLDVVCDLRSEPDFRGGLLIEVNGLQADGDVLCAAQVAVAVQNGSSPKIVLTR